jgi:hypothetical protein
MSTEIAAVLVQVAEDTDVDRLVGDLCSFERIETVVVTGPFPGQLPELREEGPPGPNAKVRRANLRVERLLRFYAAMCGGPDEPDEAVIGDLLVDLRHYVSDCLPDTTQFDGLAEASWRAFIPERDGRYDDGVREERSAQWAPLEEWVPLGDGPITREAIAPRAAFIRCKGRGHREPLRFTLAGGNVREGVVQAIETDGVRVDGELLKWTQIMEVKRS